MGDNDTPKTMAEEFFFTELVIRKVRHLENITIPLSEKKRKHLILTGRNGSGKTSVLEALQEFIKSDLMQGRDIHMYTNIKYCFIQGYFPAGKILFAYYTAKRKSNLAIPDGPKKIDLKIEYKFHDQPGWVFLQYLVNLKADKSFARDDNDIETVDAISNWFIMFENGLKEIFEDPSLTLEFDRKDYNFKINQRGKEPFDFNTLADGYSSILHIVTDLIMRMEKKKTNIYDVQGLVLIDELEAHLHIGLQKKIFPFLTRFFPRIQFIVTTHSPFVLSSIENAVVYDLEKKILVDNLSAYSYDGIIEGYFDNDKYSDVAKEEIRLYEELVNKENKTDEEHHQMMKLRNYLSQIDSKLAMELKMKFQQIELDRITRSK